MKWWSSKGLGCGVGMVPSDSFPLGGTYWDRNHFPRHWILVHPTHYSYVWTALRSAWFSDVSDFEPLRSLVPFRSPALRRIYMRSIDAWDLARKLADCLSFTDSGNGSSWLIWLNFWGLHIESETSSFYSNFMVPNGWVSSFLIHFSSREAWNSHATFRHLPLARCGRRARAMPPGWSIHLQQLCQWLVLTKQMEK